MCTAVLKQYLPRIAGEALKLLEQCKELAPTLPELYTVQSRILKHAGDPQGAAVVACKAEIMDLADRSDPRSPPHHLPLTRCKHTPVLGTSGVTDFLMYDGGGLGGSV